MKITKYPDGTSYVSETRLGEQVFRVNTYEDLWHLAQFVDAFHSEYDTPTTKMKPNIIIPNLIDAQADRRFNLGESSGLKLVLRFLNNLDANFIIFHPHNGEVVEAMMDNVEILDNKEFISDVLSDLYIDFQGERESGGLEDHLVLMSSDAGGFKPLMKLCDKLGWEGDTYSASKSRKYVEGKSKLVQLVDKQDFEGKDILIVDDICVNGGTFIGLAKLLRERNCGKLFLAISHLTVENPNPELFKAFDKIYTTDSKGFEYLTAASGHDRASGVKPENLEIISLF